ncbi:MAG: 6,7-dimethyl-8-ribityllumazine synthase [Pseudomonadota bacterium]
MSNLKIYEGSLQGKGKKIGIVFSRFNSFITDKLLEGALDALKRTGVIESDIKIVKVPGAFEIPVALKKMATTSELDAIICLGSVIKGNTSHNEYISSEVTKGVAQIMLETGVPVSFGILTPDTLEQAIERAGSKHGNKGFEAAMSAIEMADLFKKI